MATPEKKDWRNPGLKLKNCPECGKVYIDAGVGLCRDCVYEREQRMAMVSSYIRDNPRCSIQEVCDALGVKQSLVLYMLKKGYLLEQEVSIRYPCARCGRMIRYGRYCASCGKELKDELAKRSEDAKKRAEMSQRGTYSRGLQERLGQGRITKK